MNKIQLRGRVGADPEVRTLQSGVKVATFSLATEESWLVEGERKKRTTRHIVETFRPSDVAVIEAHVVKGALIRLDGALRVEDWKDKNDVKHYTTKVITSDWEHGVYSDPRGAAKAKDAAE